MNWFGDINRRTGEDAADWSYPPSGGRVKLVLLGIIVPLLIMRFGLNAWITEEAVWFGRLSRSSVVVHGATAQSLAVVYGSAGLFCHFRWFWGLLSAYRAFEVGTIVSLIGFLGGLLCAVYHLFA